MRKIAAFLIFALLGLFVVSPAQDLTCADVNEDGYVNLSDLTDMFVSHLGGPPLPDGKGDIDFRAGYNTGDWSHLIDYIFMGGPAPDCPPFGPYTPQMTDDTLFLPSFVIPAGSGQISSSIVFKNLNIFRHILVPLEIDGLGAGVTIDSISLSGFSSTSFPESFHYINGNTVTFAQGELTWGISPGLHALATLYFSYDNAEGTLVSVDTATLPQNTFLNYSFGEPSPSVPAEVGIPKVVSAGGGGFPNMNVSPDSLFFYTLAGLENPDPQSFSIMSDGAEFSWFIDKPDWIDVSTTFGSSDVTIDVQPDISGFQVGTYTGEINIYSPDALGSPTTVKVVLQLRSQYPSFDANCDQEFNISDIVTLINYLFIADAPEPCDPCTGGVLK